MAEQKKKERKRRILDAETRRKIVAAGRRKERPSVKEAAEQFGVDAPIVRRVWQAAGIVVVKAEVREKAKRLVATWIERARQ